MSNTYTEDLNSSTSTVELNFIDNTNKEILNNRNNINNLIKKIEIIKFSLNVCILFNMFMIFYYLCQTI